MLRNCWKQKKGIGRVLGFEAGKKAVLTDRLNQFHWKWSAGSCEKEVSEWSRGSGLWGEKEGEIAWGADNWELVNE